MEQKAFEQQKKFDLSKQKAEERKKQLYDEILLKRAEEKAQKELSA